MSFIRRAFDFIGRPSHSRTLGIVIFFILVATLSLTVYVAQQQQQIKQRASDYCTDTSIQECPDNVGVIEGGNCVTDPSFKCKITNKDNNTYKVYRCQ